MLRTISALLLSLPLLSGPFHGNSVSRNSGIMNILEDTATCIFHRVLVLSVLGNSPVELITSQSPSSSNIVRPGSNSSSNSNSVPTQHAAPYNKSSACNNSNSSRYSSISSSSSKHVNSADIKVVNSVSTTVNSEIQIMAALWISEIR